MQNHLLRKQLTSMAFSKNMDGMDCPSQGKFYPRMTDWESGNLPAEKNNYNGMLQNCKMTWSEKDNDQSKHHISLIAVAYIYIVLTK